MAATAMGVPVLGTSNPLVDCHTHIFSPDMPVARGAWIQPDYAFTADDLLALLDEHGVHFALISGLSIIGYYNDYMISQLRQHRRLRGTAILPPSVDRYTLEQMQRDGIVGIRLQLARLAESSALPDLTSDEYRLLLRRARDLGWHVHVAIEGPHLRGVLEPLLASGVNIVVDHFGHPDPAQPSACDGFRAMVEAVETGRVWVKMSGGFRLPGTRAWQDDPAGDLESLAASVAQELVAKVGTDRLLWGSDAPFVGYEKRISYASVLASYKRWMPDAQKRDEMDRTALKLYFQ